MHKSNFVAAVKCNDQVLREISGREVRLPFNSEYSLLLKNKNSRRAIVEIKVDSKVVFSELIIPAFGETELERFQDQSKKFKFVKLESEGVSDKENPENGLVEVDFWLEEEPVKEIIKEVIREVPVWPRPWTPWYPRPYWEKPWYQYYPDQYHPDDYRITFCNTAGGNDTGSYKSESNLTIKVMNCSDNLSEQSNMGTTKLSANVNSVSFPDGSQIPSDEGKAGATVEGDVSSQRFTSVYFRGKDLSTYTQIKIWLRATDKPITVQDTKIVYCSQCGSKCKHTDNFCHKCASELTKETA